MAFSIDSLMDILQKKSPGQHQVLLGFWIFVNLTRKSGISLWFVFVLSLKRMNIVESIGRKKFFFLCRLWRGLRVLHSGHLWWKQALQLWYCLGTAFLCFLWPQSPCLLLHHTAFACGLCLTFFPSCTTLQLSDPGNSSGSNIHHLCHALYKSSKALKAPPPR